MANKESINVDPLDKDTQAKVGGANASRGSTHQQYVENIAVYGNGDFVRQGVDTTDPGMIDGPNLVGTEFEGDPEALGLTPNDAYREQVGVKQRAQSENK